MENFSFRYGFLGKRNYFFSAFSGKKTRQPFRHVIRGKSSNSCFENFFCQLFKKTEEKQKRVDAINFYYPWWWFVTISPRTCLNSKSPISPFGFRIAVRNEWVCFCENMKQIYFKPLKKQFMIIGFLFSFRHNCRNYKTCFRIIIAFMMGELSFLFVCVVR